MAALNLTCGPITTTPPHSLNWNSICAEGARTLAAALPQCKALQALQYVGVTTRMRALGGWAGGLAPDVVARVAITQIRTKGSNPTASALTARAHWRRHCHSARPCRR